MSRWWAINGAGGASCMLACTAVTMWASDIAAVSASRSSLSIVTTRSKSRCMAVSSQRPPMNDAPYQHPAPRPSGRPVRAACRAGIVASPRMQRTPIMDITSRQVAEIPGGLALQTTLDGERIDAYVVTGVADLEAVADIVPREKVEAGAEIHVAAVDAIDTAQEQVDQALDNINPGDRSEEHTSEL